MSTYKEILVYAHWAGMQDPTLVGTLNILESRGEETLSFEYDAAWLKNNAGHALDPYLQFYKGKFFPPSGENNFGLLLDSAPGNWGRMLLQKNEIVSARKEKREAKSLSETETLSRVFDFYRSGALRFKDAGEDEFLVSDPQYILPSFTALRELEAASIICAGPQNNDSEFISAMELLLHPGAALGGKRPKANVVDDAWQMWMAKFPRVTDEVDVGGWEFVAHTLAALAGIQTAPSMIRKLGSQHHTFISQRFDRNTKGERIHFASAMTMTGYSTGNAAITSAGYIDLAEFLMRHGADVNKDLEELWRRIVFNIAISNTDDHLRNHGFLLTERGWKLSPVFDLNPDPAGRGLTLNISERDNALEFDLALSVADYFRVKPDKARSIVQLVKVAAGQWQKVASDAGILKTEQEKMSAAFSRV